MGHEKKISDMGQILKAGASGRQIKNIFLEKLMIATVTMKMRKINCVTNITSTIELPTQHYNDKDK